MTDGYVQEDKGVGSILCDSRGEIIPRVDVMLRERGMHSI